MDRICFCSVKYVNLPECKLWTGFNRFFPSQFFVRVYLHGFGKAISATSGKDRKGGKGGERLDENANKIEEKKVK